MCVDVNFINQVRNRKICLKRGREGKSLHISELLSKIPEWRGQGEIAAIDHERGDDSCFQLT